MPILLSYADIFGKNFKLLLLPENVVSSNTKLQRIFFRFGNTNTNTKNDGLNTAQTSVFSLGTFIFGLHASIISIKFCDLYVSVIIFGFIELVARVRSWCTVDN